MTVTAPSANGTSRSAAPRTIQRPPTALELIRSSDRTEAETTTPPASDSAPAAHPSKLPGFSPEQLAALAAPLDRANVRQREQGRSKVHYLEGWQVIAEANRIFGFDGWQRQTIAVRCVAQAERLIGREQKPGWGVTYTARVRVTVTAGNRTLIREGSGAGHGIDADQGLAHESALKEAETDATKRALMTFGNPFGLALYDKQQRQVSPARGSSTAAVTTTTSVTKPTASVAPAKVPNQGPPAAQAPGSNDTPLNAPAITALQARIRALSPVQREAFTTAFRAAFAVPPSQSAIAGLITTSRHQRWIEAFLTKPAAA
jgi:DNA recombination protein Rad52